MPSQHPLQGVTVVAIEQAVAGPFATRQLADLGARVIKIERPVVGDFARTYDRTVHGLSSYFVWLNRSKESVTLDLKRAEAQQALRALIARADVVVHNLAPGAAERLGLDPSDLRRDHPRLIVCRITGYGLSGPYSRRKAYDLLVQSEAGLLSITGTADHPAKVGVSIADIAAGMYAYSGILTALLVRERTGRGTTVDVSLFDALSEWMSQPAYFTAYGGSPPARSGVHHASIAPYGPFATLDGTHVYLAIQNDREWQRLCRDVLAQPALADDPRFAHNADRVRHRADVDRLVASTLQTLSPSSVTSALDRAGIAHARMNSVSEFLRHPQLTERHRWIPVTTPAGTIDALRPPVSLEDLEPRMDAVPDVGQHTEHVLEELGIEPHTVAQWRTAGII